MPEGLVKQESDGYYSLDYSQLSAPMIRFQQGLFDMIVALMERVAKLEGFIDRFQKVVMKIRIDVEMEDYTWYIVKYAYDLPLVLGTNLMEVSARLLDFKTWMEEALALAEAEEAEEARAAEPLPLYTREEEEEE
ncbi:hypothetical protein HK104_006748 [Borealophlyctis nickersoniae]|nr:hypothetical protein HK104_006748 [Borealophlyctis nickersoniae]